MRPPVAVYGTLRSEFDIQRQLDLPEEMRLIGPCTIPGLLYDLGPYPALMPGDGSVIGELYDVAAASLWVLDRYEGFDPDDERGSLFLRRLIRLTQPDTEAWVYVYNAPIGQARLIAGGDYVSR